MSDEAAPLLSSVNGEDASKHNGYNTANGDGSPESSTANSTSGVESEDSLGVPVKEDKSFKTLAFMVSMSFLSSSLRLSNGSR